MQPDRFDTFARGVLGAGYTTAKATQIKDGFGKWVAQFGEFMDKSLPAKSPWGPGRLDTFGMIFNRVVARDLGMPDNFKVADAPVSYPFLWNASRQDRTQWKGGVPNGLYIHALARNTGEVFGVFADFAARRVTGPTPLSPARPRRLAGGARQAAVRYPLQQLSRSAVFGRCARRLAHPCRRGRHGPEDGTQFGAHVRRRTADGRADAAARDNQRNLAADQFGRQLGQQIVLPLGPAKVDLDVLPGRIAGFAQPIAKRRDEIRERSRRPAVQKTDHRQLRLLRSRGKRACDCRGSQG